MSESSAIRRLREWIDGRIGQCRKDETKFKPSTDAMLEACTERRTLQSVLARLDEVRAKKEGGK